MVRIADGDVYPESMTVTRDGSVIAGSMIQPYIYRALPGTAVATRWIDLRPTGSTSYGVLADDARRRLWVCTVEHPLTDRGPVPLAERHTTLRAFDLASGEAEGAWPLPDRPNACNDIALAPDGSLYVSDSGDARRILRLRPTAGGFELAFTGPEAERVDGITFVRNRLYFASIATGRLFRLPLDSAGRAGKPVEIRLSRPLVAPDGMRSDGKRIYVAESRAGRVVEVTLDGDTGNVRTLAEGLDGPSAVSPQRDTLWFVELKARRLPADVRDPSPEPFDVRSVRITR